MRRFGILLGSVVWLVGMAVIMGCGMEPYVLAVTPVAQTEMLQLPCPVLDAQMEAKTMAWYEGPFREDGSDQEVTGVAALAVTNTGDTMIAKGAVIMEYEDKRMVFEVFGLPAGETALVLEKDQSPYCTDRLTACYGWESREYPENMGHISVQEAGDAKLLVINRTDGRMPVVRIRFKSYDAESQMYIGGICYETAVRDLLPGESREISPYHFLCGSSRVIGVTVEAE